MSRLPLAGGFFAGYIVLSLPPVMGHGFSTIELVATALLGCGLVSLSVIDIASYRLPDPITLSLTALGVLLSGLMEWDDAIHRIAAAALGFTSLYAVAYFYRRLRNRHGLGLGDAKLFAASGAWLGFEGLPSVLLLASVTALILASIALAAGRTVQAGSKIPFGPFLAFGTWMVWLYGPVNFAL